MRSLIIWPNDVLTYLRGVFVIDSKGAETHRALLSWKHQNSDDESSTTFLYPFTFTCEIHVHLCESMNCPCVCINYLFEHYQKTKFESTFKLKFMKTNNFVWIYIIKYLIQKMEYGLYTIKQHRTMIATNFLFSIQIHNKNWVHLYFMSWYNPVRPVIQ